MRVRTTLRVNVKGLPTAQAMVDRVDEALLTLSHFEVERFFLILEDGLEYACTPGTPRPEAFRGLKSIHYYCADVWHEELTVDEIDRQWEPGPSLWSRLILGQV